MKTDFDPTDIDVNEEQVAACRGLARECGFRNVQYRVGSLQAGSMRLKDGKLLPQRRGDAEKMSHSITGMESPNGESLQECRDSRFPVSLRASASLREIATAWRRPGTGNRSKPGR